MVEAREEEPHPPTRTPSNNPAGECNVYRVRVPLLAVLVLVVHGAFEP